MKRIEKDKKSEDSDEDEIWNYKSVRSTHSKPPIKVGLNSDRSGPGVAFSVVRPRSSDTNTKNASVKNKSRRSLKSADRKRAKKPNKDDSGGLVAVRNSQSSEGGSGDPQISRPSHLGLRVGHCPSCQAPFSVLTTDSPDVHAAKCLDNLSCSSRPECSKGAHCASNILCHYQMFSHDILAQIRAHIESDDCPDKTEVEVPETSDEFNAGTSSKRLKFAPNNEDFEKVAQCPSQSDVLCDLFSDDSIADEKQLNNSNVCDKQEVSQESLITNFLKSNNSPISESGSKNSLTSPNHFKAPEVELQDEISALEMFRDISEMLDVVFSDEELPASEPSQFEISLGSANHSTRRIDEKAPELHNANNHFKMIGNGSIGSQISAVSSARDRDKKAPKSRLKSSPKAKKSSAIGQSRNSQQLSINNYFKRVDATDGKPVTTKELSLTLGKKIDEVVLKGVPNSACKTEKLFNGVLESPANVQPVNFDNQAKNSECFDKMNSLGSGSKKTWNPNKVAMHSNETTNLAGKAPGQYVRKCPFYKKIPNTRFCVDAFSYGTIPGCSAYFLSHFHSDHYMGLKKSFPHDIYCSKVTSNLVSLKFRVSPGLLHALPLNTPQMVDGVEVTLLDANHCPGSVMLIFKLSNGQAFLHTGDFRADPCMEEWFDLQSIRISSLFLDTTYCDPTYDFPSQKDVVKFAVDKTVEFVSRHSNVLVAVGTYSIGKERIFLAIADALNSKIFVSRDKKLMLNCLEDKNLNERITLKSSEARLHVLRMNQLNLTDLNSHLENLRPEFEHLLAFEPTGWTHSRKVLSLDNLRPKTSSKYVTVYAVPYSEHSSYSEMKRFVQFLHPAKIIPTVNNGNPSSRKKMEELFHAWMANPDDLSSRTNKQPPLQRWLERNS